MAVYRHIAPSGRLWYLIETMTKKSIDPEEAQLFRDSVGKVKPLNHDKHSMEPKKKTIAPKAPQKEPPPFHWNPTSDDWLNAEDSVHFAKPGLQHKVIQRLKQGRILPEATIDLHQQTIDEAVKTISFLIADGVTQGRRCILIIHGKGHFSAQGKPVLKNFLNQWLRGHPDVLAFHSTSPKQGGTGALIVLLKKRGLHEK
ncbi:Smr/MutS family protein [Coxiella burnetii]|uniref:Smr/MutS family protein n=1 Tax=Coxiella burnetii (strain RSA 493 / Nine Mile phase I) TaxID=227377 RepID=Q83D68_COXBU|nr:Smr/MutS family protein [Coxiella burnetii]NP_819891.1 Smr/MutS family protein [Coxiella burnetii RSA 493]AAO90405.1 Smr/MutS family protein [Coxiella burnetii RSA 493]ARI65705.1 DNA mismatch repair protein MutS [Coxiella burnetii]ARK27180.1 DNA mismatch repair protein MutS [Coxiella burnetii]MCF2092907.1 Smr/MutS family protein [Coxiella burnetii]MCF2094897.1 Smr/MutS family protein [Coxiella burnetii]